MREKFIIWGGLAFIAGTVIAYIFAKDEFWIFVGVAVLFLFASVPIWWCWSYGGPPWEVEGNSLRFFFIIGSGVMLFTALIFAVGGTIAYQGLSKVSESLLCPSGYENMVSTQSTKSYTGADAGGVGLGFSLLCKGEKGSFRPNKTFYGFLVGGLYAVYGVGTILLTWGVHILFIGNISEHRRSQLALFLTLPLIPLLYFLPGWIARLTGPLIW